MKRTVLIFLSALLLSGCGVTGGIHANYRALEEMRLVQTLGLDSAGGGVKLSAATGKLGEGGAPLLLAQEGPDIPRAMDALQDYSTEGRLFFSHAQYLVAGRAAAEQGLGALLDFAERDIRMRLGTELYVLLEGTAEDFVQNAGGDGGDVSEALSSVKQDVALRALSRAGTVRETAVALSETGAALVCLLRPVPAEEGDPAKGLAAVPVGYGVLRDGQLAGVLEGETAEAVSLLRGDSGSAHRGFDGVTLRFTGADSAITAQRDGGPVRASLRLKVNAVVAAAESGAPLPDPSALCAALERSLEANLREAVELSRTLDADFLALSRQLGGTQSLPADWLRELDCDITVEAVLDRQFDLGGTVSLDGGGAA